MIQKDGQYSVTAVDARKTEPYIAALVQHLWKTSNRKIEFEAQTTLPTKIIEVPVKISNFRKQFIRVSMTNTECAPPVCSWELSDFLEMIRLGTISILQFSGSNKTFQLKCPGCGKIRSSKDYIIDLASIKCISVAKNFFISNDRLDLLSEKTHCPRDLFIGYSNIGTASLRYRSQRHFIANSSMILSQNLKKPLNLGKNSQAKTDARIQEVNETVDTLFQALDVADKVNSILSNVFCDIEIQNDSFSFLAEFVEFLEENMSTYDQKEPPLNNFAFYCSKDFTSDLPETYSSLIDVYDTLSGKVLRNIPIKGKADGLFKIPKGARLIQAPSFENNQIKLLITGGYSSLEKRKVLQPTVFETVFEALELRVQTTQLGYYETGYQGRFGLPTETAPMKHPRGLHAICYDYFRNQIIVASGLKNASLLTDSVEIGVFEEDKNTTKLIWYELGKLSQARAYASICATESYLFVFGGIKKQIPEDYFVPDEGETIEVVEVERFDFREGIWKIVTKIIDEMALLNPSYCLYSENRNEIYIFGGRKFGLTQQEKFSPQHQERERTIYSFNIVTYKMITEVRLPDEMAELVQGHYGFMKHQSKLVILGRAKDAFNVLCLFSYDIASQNSNSSFH